LKSLYQLGFLRFF